MPSDFGDESGEKLFDWMLKVGQDASEEAMLATANRLKEAFKTARGELGANSDGKVVGETAEWAKLKLTEFETLPEYDTIKEAIDKKLSTYAIEHDFFTDKHGSDFLLFRLERAPEVSKAFEELELQTQMAYERASSSLDSRSDLSRAHELQKRAPKLDTPATKKQIEYICSLQDKGFVPEEEMIHVEQDAPTIGDANKLLNKYGHFLKLGKDEPLSDRAERVRQAARVLENGDREHPEIELSELRSK